QFGNFVPQLGDGRAILLGEIVDTRGVRRDIQLKGSGPTPFSRRGDGRAALGPVLREYIVSEAMHALGIPTTRSLAAVLTGDEVLRETALPGAVLTRVASSHIRVGTFQYFAARQDIDALRLLADHVIARHYPEVSAADYRALFEAVLARQAALVARWMLVGFIHGVMNTDNTSIAGETIDYGPCAFMDTYHPNTVFSSIDQGGRYAYANQGRIAVWNLARFAETLLPLFSEDDDQALAQANESLQKFSGLFADAWFSGLRRKLGLADAQPEDEKLAQDLLNAMAANSADFTLTFRRLCDAAADPAADGAVRDLFLDPTAYDSWAMRWRQRLSGDPASRRAAMQAVNPAYIPRNHRVEAAITAAIAESDFQPFEELLLVLSRPFEDRPEFAAYAEPPLEDERVLRTFCGT
ncbi:MAG: YdiU family protein, partial [Reyranellaceae bacterium]